MISKILYRIALCISMIPMPIRYSISDYTGEIVDGNIAYIFFRYGIDALMFHDMKFIRNIRIYKTEIERNLSGYKF